MVRFGVIGCGVISYWTHLRLLRKMRGVELVAAADPDSDARERARSLAGVAVHADAAELLGRDDIDAVVISAPTQLHAELGVQAAEAGKHLYLEKPAACQREEGRRLAVAVSESGVAAAIGFNRRFHPMCRQARELIRSGEYGQVRAVLSSHNEPLDDETMPGWKRQRSTGGGVLLDLASHHFDLMEWLLGDEIASLQAQVHSRETEDDEASVKASTKSGVPVQSYFSFRAARADFVEVLLESGSLRIDRHRPALSLRVSRKGAYGVTSGRVRWDGEALRYRALKMLRPSYDPSYRGALATFVDAIGAGGGSVPTIADGLRNLEVVLACEESARSGRAIDVLPPAT